MSANTANAKIIGFTNNSITEDIYTILTDGKLSKTTVESYRIHLNEFISYFCKGKDLSNVTLDDLIVRDTHGEPKQFKFTYNDIRRYRSHLLKLPKLLSNNTVNHKIACARAVFKELAKDRPYFNIAVFDLKRLDSDEESYGDFSHEEIKMMIEKAKTYANGEEKSMFILLSCITSFRVSSTLNLTWKHIKKHDDETYVVYAQGKATGKGNKKDEKSISRDVYEQLLELKGKHEDDKIFHMSRKSVWEFMKMLIVDLGLDVEGERNLSTHSLKNFGINQIYEITKDIKLMQQQGNHSNPSTTIKHYRKLSKDPKKNPSLLVMTEEDTSIIQEATLEQLLKAICQCDENTRIQISRKLKGIMG